MLLVTQGTESMRTFASLNQFNFFSGVFRHVINLNAITACETNQQCLIVRRDKHISGHGARFHAPLDGLGVQINGDQLIAVLHGGPHSGALAVNPHVAGCFSRLNALDQGGRLPIPFVDVDVIESVGDRDEPFHVGRKTQVIRVQNAGNDALDFCGSGLYISEGPSAGQLRKVVKYWGANNTLIVNSAFTVTPTTSSRYVISPLVTIRGDSGGTTTSRATAYASNTTGGIVRKITVISQGRSYSTANATITANSSHGFGATARPIISPLNGHGSDPVDELGGTTLFLNITANGSQSNTFPTNNDFRLIGIMRDPILLNGSYANSTVIDQTTRIGVQLVTGDFIEDEIVVGATSGAKARLVYFANTNGARTQGVAKVIRVTTNGTGGSFTPGETLTGTVSSVTANVVSLTKPALKPHTGFVIYTENREAVLRDPAQTEDYKIAIKY